MLGENPKAVVAIPTPHGNVHLHSPTDDPGFLQRVSKAIHEASNKSSASAKIPPKLATLILSAHGRQDVSRRLELLSNDQLRVLQVDILEGIRAKSARPDGSYDPVKARKIFLSLGDSGKEIWGSDYRATKRQFDQASKASIAAK
jgi:hypothetical protein